MDKVLPDHLGGHAGITHIDGGVLRHLKKKLNITSMIDVGCGPGGMVELARELGILSFGIDGDDTIQRFQSPCYIHDFTTGPFQTDNFDLAWSVEFLEHVEEKYMDNYFSVFEKCKYVVCTHAVPGQGGHHHVNLQDMAYWIAKFRQRQFDYDMETTKEIREVSSMKKNFMRNTGLFFNNRRFV